MSKQKIISLQDSRGEFDDLTYAQLVSPGSNPEILQPESKIDNTGLTAMNSCKEKHQNGMSLYRNNGRVRSGIITARGRTTILAQKRALQKPHNRSNASTI